MTKSKTPADTVEKASKADEKEFERMREAANSADMTDSPALNNDAETPEGGVGEQRLPKGNRYD